MTHLLSCWTAISLTHICVDYEHDKNSTQFLVIFSSPVTSIKPISICTNSDPLATTQLGCCYSNASILQRNKYATWMLQQTWTSRQEYTCCSVCGFSSDSRLTALFCSHFSCCRFSKIEVQTLSWLIRWHHWWANQWHAVWRHHILAPAWIAWNPSWSDTILVPVTRYCDLKTTVNHAESIRVGTNWKGA